MLPKHRTPLQTQRVEAQTDAVHLTLARLSGGELGTVLCGYLVSTPDVPPQARELLEECYKRLKEG